MIYFNPITKAKNSLTLGTDRTHRSYIGCVSHREALTTSEIRNQKTLIQIQMRYLITSKRGTMDR